MSAPLDWNQLATLIGLAGIVSGGVSAGINYGIERRKEKNKRAADVVSEQAQLLSAFTYNLTILITGMHKLLAPYEEDEEKSRKVYEAGVKDIENIKQKIDSILENKIHLLEYNSWDKWLRLRQDLELDTSPADAVFLVLSELSDALASEFESVIAKYEKLGFKSRAVTLKVVKRSVAESLHSSAESLRHEVASWDISKAVDTPKASSLNGLKDETTTENDKTG